MAIVLPVPYSTCLDILSTIRSDSIYHVIKTKQHYSGHIVTADDNRQTASSRAISQCIPCTRTS
ncbi:uncharacterized protein B0P05DRAFT_80931 [Gilbertella persicaria]|uniref:uncharacterized protein n=1 Tax=Gilbertella persicaria TaxID=101096 RepID=UPI00221E7AAA|nr:uncharacterized protein B0P05DRAFT_80931 [Gilbertella persicaria]KAI8080223.1 hypothetical protein B0P05DRAFT_80931 [Gilbertella persicaria]